MGWRHPTTNPTEPDHLALAIPETCRPGEGILLFMTHSGAALPWQPGVRGDRPEAARPACSLDCQSGTGRSGAARRRLEQEKKV